MQDVTILSPLSIKSKICKSGHQTTGRIFFMESTESYYCTDSHISHYLGHLSVLNLAHFLRIVPRLRTSFSFSRLVTQKNYSWKSLYHWYLHPAVLCIHLVNTLGVLSSLESSAGNKSQHGTLSLFSLLQTFYIFRFRVFIKIHKYIWRISFIFPLYDGHTTCQVVTESKIKLKPWQRTTMSQSNTT